MAFVKALKIDCGSPIFFKSLAKNSSQHLGEKKKRKKETAAKFNWSSDSPASDVLGQLQGGEGCKGRQEQGSFKDRATEGRKAGKRSAADSSHCPLDSGH